jgi:hypothetical protein
VDEFTWSKKDIAQANYNLKRMLEELKLPEPVLDSYESNRSGTQKLSNDLISGEKYPKQIIMGCLICHQLRYRIPLVATFLTGQPNSDYESESDISYNDDSQSE